ncbi:type I secretion system permease/ATPase [Inhella proteolytica]|uniref:Type I secretion system permease/ATPase n=1 Tax=Inhella proteolytica TaxID=2795029 RepID=A0A931J4A6_9BURK|nr:type I secretion system permease/ATPase [Inhella proteolytica]MBH9578021.1 type I secretion system permease/ATPase [Inhella proteolytica]
MNTAVVSAGAPAPQSTVQSPKLGFFERSELGRALWRFRRELLWVCIFSFFANLLSLTSTVYMLQVYDRVMLSGNELTLAALSLLALLFYFVMGFAEWLRSRLLVRAGALFDDRLNTRVFNASFEARLRGMAKNPLQALGDLTNLRQFITGSGVFAVMDLPWMLVYVGVLFLMHRWLGWAALAFCVLQLAMALVSHRLVSSRHKKAQELSLETNGFLQAKLRNAETVEALGMLGNLRRQWLSLYERQLQGQADAQELQRRIQAVTKFVQYFQQSLILAIGAVLALQGSISAGAMIASNALMTNALRPISMVVGLWKQYVETAAAYRRLEQVLADNPVRESAPGDRSLHGQISLRDLSANAPGRKTPILKNLTIDFNPGEVVAIVGPSGAGKSTLARCLLGIWPDTTGEVLLDQRPIAQWSREDLGPQVGYLPQDIEMFEGTIAENIARFEKVDPQQIIEAAQRTGIHDMILRLPKGYDTPMGEAGGLLSGGQRQRIGLARAVIGDPAIVVLDEPNANLDDVGEAALIRAVKDLKARGKTVFMIVHQQHILAAADRVLILENGQISRFLPVVHQPAPQNNPQA